MRAMTAIHLLCALTCSALPPPAFSIRTQTGKSDWNQNDLKMIYDLSRPARHADGLFTSGYSRLLSQLTAKDYLESLVTKRCSRDATENQVPVKRHSDAIFTNNYSRFRKQMAARNYLSFILQGKRLHDVV